jgi:SAM-dependent methyltransferase
MLEESANYDAFAWVYNRHWGPKTPRKFLPILRECFLGDLPLGGHLLDVCCGTGQLDHALHTIGYQVTGIDASPEMIRFARENAPGCEFVVADVRDFSVPGSFDGALCMYDSLNHLMTLDDLQRAFATIHRALKPQAPFMFDLNNQDSFRTNWCGSFGIVDDELVCVIRPSFREEDQIAEFLGTVMIPESRASAWRRTDIHLSQRCFKHDEVTATLSAAGFSNTHVLDLGARSTGKDFFCCRAD